MARLDKLKELNKLQKLNRKKISEDILKQEYYGEKQELFDPLTKTLNTHNEQNLALGEQTLRAIDWQNQGLYRKQGQSPRLVLR